MKTQSILKTALLAAGLSVALIGSARAQVVVSANFDAGSGNYSGANASGTGGNFFNDIAVTGPGSSSTSDSLSNLKDSNDATVGTGTGITATLTDDVLIQSYVVGAPTFAPVLFEQGAYSGYNSGNPGGGGAKLTFTLSGLSSTDTYNLYLYSEIGSYLRGAQFTINGTPLTAVNTAADDSGFVANGNYVEFTGLTGSSSYAADVAYDSGGNDYFNGFTLVDTTAVPEPSTYALIGLGALGLAFLIRRRRHSLV
jgi:uncharacterized membrane protein